MKYFMLCTLTRFILSPTVYQVFSFVSFTKFKIFELVLSQVLGSFSFGSVIFLLDFLNDSNVFLIFLT